MAIQPTSRITLHLKDDPSEHSILLDGHAWEDVQAIQVQLGKDVPSAVPMIILTCYIPDSFRVVGKCKPIAGLPPDKLVTLHLTFGREATKTDPGERAAVFLGDREVHFENLRVWVTGGQQVLIQFDRIQDDLPLTPDDTVSDGVPRRPRQWVAMFLVHGSAGNDVEPFTMPPREDPPPIVMPSLGTSEYDNLDEKSHRGNGEGIDDAEMTGKEIVS